MDVLARFYRILRANFPTGGPAPVEEDGPWSWKPGYAPGSQRPDSSPEIDPQLAVYYANLEIPYGSELADVRKAWKRLLKKYHPDLHAGDANKRQVANQLTAQLTEAYKELEIALTKKEKH
jgi:hypothetical protein